MSKIKLPEGVTEANINAWKEKFGKVKIITCKCENGKSVEFIIAQPTREILDAWAHHHNNDNIAKARQVLESNCILHGDKTLFEKDVNLQSTVLKKVQEMLTNLEVEEKEL